MKKKYLQVFIFIYLFKRKNCFVIIYIYIFIIFLQGERNPGLFERETKIVVGINPRIYQNSIRR